MKDSGAARIILREGYLENFRGEGTIDNFWSELASFGEKNNFSRRVMESVA